MSQCHQFEFIDLIDWRASPHSREPPKAGARPPSRGAVIAATTTSGTGGGSGGGSGSGLRGDSVVLTKERDTVAIEACKIGETPALSIARRWRILDPHPAGCSARGRHFIRLHFSNADSIDVTPHHIFTLADGSPSATSVSASATYSSAASTALRSNASKRFSRSRKKSL